MAGARRTVPHRGVRRRRGRSTANTDGERDLGGGEVSAARHPIVGRDKVARYLVGLLRRFADGIDVTFDEVNGHPAVLGHTDGELAGMFVPDFTADRLRTVHIVASPSKLRYAARQLAARPATRASSRAG